MSPAPMWIALVASGFPRVSGDEPDAALTPTGLA